MKLQLLFLFLPIMVIFIGCDEPDHSIDKRQELQEQRNDTIVEYDSTRRDHTDIAADTLVPGGTKDGATSEPGR